MATLEQINEIARKHGMPIISAGGETPSVPSLSRRERLTQSGAIKAAPAPGLTERADAVREDSASKIRSAITGEGEYAGQSSITRGVSAAAELASTPLKVGYEILPKFARTGLKKVGDAIGSGFNKVVDKISDNKSLQNFMVDVPKNSGGEQILSTLAGGGAIAGEVLGAKGTGALSETGAKVGAKSLNVAGDVTAGTGRLIEGTGKKIYQSAIDPTVKEAEKIINYQAKNTVSDRIGATAKGTTLPGSPVLRSETAFESGLKGSEKMIGVQAKREANNLWKSEIQPALDASADVVTKEELFKPIMDKINRTMEPGKKKAYQEAAEAIADEYKDFDQVSLNTAQDIKSTLDEFTPEKLFKGKSVGSEYNTLRHEMADAIRQKIYNSLKDVNVKKKYLDYANLTELQKIGVKALTDGGLKGGFGSFWSSIWDKVTTPVKTIGGRTVYRIGNAFEFVGDKGFNTFGDFLNSQGYKVNPQGFLIAIPAAENSIDD